MGTPFVPLWLDHVSISVPDLAAAVEHLDRRLGLRATVSPSAPERHSRVYLHRSYLEVSAGSGSQGWEAPMFFLRFTDPETLRQHLDAAGIPSRFGQWEGVDGTWDDVEIQVGSVPLPTLIRRTAPPNVARDWPPALAEPHRCGAQALAALLVEVPSLDQAVEAYGRLLGTDPPPGPDARSHADPAGARVALASGELVLTEGSRGGIVGIVLGVPSLEAARVELEGRLGKPVDGVAWLDPGETFGLRIGFSPIGQRSKASVS